MQHALIADGDLGQTAALAVVARSAFDVITASSLAAGLPYIPAGHLSLLVVNIRGYRIATVAALCAVRSTHPSCRIIGVNARPEEDGHPFDSRLIDALVAQPLDIQEVLVQIRGFFPELLTDRTSVAPSRSNSASRRCLNDSAFHRDT